MRPFGKYQLIRRLAAGGMAEIYLATGPNPRSAELLAVKLILQAFAEDEAFMKMFLTEARLAAPLHHPNLVEIFDLGMADDQLYLAMEYIPGKPLSQVRKKSLEFARASNPGAGNRLTPLLAAAMVRQAASGLHQVHEARSPAGEPLGLVHRDISPQNLMLSQDGQVKVVDFGVAKATAVADVSRTGSLKGKVGYIAPEQLREGVVDRQVDVYALGVVLFELATGRPLFMGRTEAELLRQSLTEPPPDMARFPEVEPELGRIILKAIDPDRAHRYSTAKAMEDALASFLGNPARAGPRDLAKLMSQLFDPFPTTLAEAAAGAVSGPTTSQVLASMPERVEPLATRSTAPPVDSEQTISARKHRDGPSKPLAGKGATRPYPSRGAEQLVTDPNPAIGEEEPTATASVSVTRRDPRKVAALRRTLVWTAVACWVAIAAVLALRSRRAPPIVVHGGPSAAPASEPRRPLTPVLVSPGAGPGSPGRASDVLRLDDGKSRPPAAEIGLSDLREQAEHAISSGDYEGAIAKLRAVLRQSPNDPLSHKLLGSALAREGRFAEAAAHYRTFIELEPRDPQTPEIERLLESYEEKGSKKP